MSTDNCHFSVLRLMPNSMRGERLNVGLVVFHPNQDVTVHLDVSQERLRSFDPNLAGINWDDWASQAVKILSDAPSDVRATLLKTAFGPITTDAELGWFRASNNVEVQDNVSSLLKRLVSRPVRLVKVGRTHSTRKTKLQTQLKNWFRVQKILGRSMNDLSNNQVVEEYPISIETDSFADFAFKNGALHIMETIDLRGVDHLTASLRNKAAFKSVVLDQAADVTGGGGQRIAIVAASNYAAIKPALKMIERNADDVVAVENHKDVDRLVRKLTEALHLTQMLPSLNFP
jgi:hypothetical protein